MLELTAGLQKTPMFEAAGQITQMSRFWVRFYTTLLQIINQQTGSVVFANLPAGPVIGMTAAISDSNTAVWGNTIAGGGANKVLGWYNGTNWTVIGK